MITAMRVVDLSNDEDDKGDEIRQQGRQIKQQNQPTSQLTNQPNQVAPDQKKREDSVVKTEHVRLWALLAGRCGWICNDHLLDWLNIYYPN